MTKNLIYLVLLTFIFSCSSDDSVSKDPIDPINLPVLQTNEVTNITLYSINTSGKLIDSGDSDITEIGLVIGLSSAPTIENNLNKFIVALDDSDNFSLTISSIPANTTYYIRSYAINSEGIGYGNEVQFTSLEENVFVGDIILTTQEEVDAFGSNNYTTIYGGLFIRGSVTSLEPLASLVFVNTAFKIENTTSLTNLTGLENLKETGNVLPNGFLINNNFALQSLTGLEGLVKTRGEFAVINNNELINLQGLNNLKSNGSAAYFLISNNNNMTSLSGLESLEFLSGDFTISGMDQLTDLSALSSLYFIGNMFSIASNASLQNINGFDNLTSVDRVRIINNANLIGLDGLNNLITVNNIEIQYNNILNDLSGLNNISSPVTIGINYNNGLQSLVDLENLNIIAIGIEANPSLSSLTGLENITTLPNLTIRDNDALTNLEGLNNLTSLTSTGIKIIDNSNLSALTGLENLTQVDGYIQVLGNTILSDFCALKNLFIDGEHNGDLFFENNFNNPTTIEIVNDCD